MARTFIVVLAALLSCSYAQFRSHCTTPDHRRGVCTSIKACQMLYSCSTKTSENVREFLQKSQCGTDNDGNLAVCCEVDGYKPSLTSKISNPCYPEVLPRISNKLPSECGITAARRRFTDPSSHPTNFPWVVLLEYNSPTGIVTGDGGVLISDRYVLIAAQSIANETIRVLRSVRFGEYRKSKDPDCFSYSGNNTRICLPRFISIPVEKKIITHQYSDNSKFILHDIALLKLATPVVFNDYIQPICLPGTLDEPSTYMVANWAVTHFDCESDVKLQINMSHVSRDECLNAMHLKLNNFHMCAKTEAYRENSCDKVNAGAPLMAPVLDKNGVNRWTVFGVLSMPVKHWDGQEVTISSDIFSKINYYIDWILQNMD